MYRSYYSTIYYTNDNHLTQIQATELSFLRESRMIVENKLARPSMPNGSKLIKIIVRYIELVFREYRGN